jgi:integrase
MKKHAGVCQRHGRACASRAGRRCNCNPSYEAFVFDQRAGRKIRQTFPTLSAAKAWRSDALGEVRRGKLRAGTDLTLRAAAEAWLEGAKRGTVLTRGGAQYKPGVIRGYEADLKRYVLPDLGAHQLSALRRADLQGLVDRLVAGGHSASKVNNVVMPVRTVCRHALERDEITVNPTANLRLPRPTGLRDRTVTPAEAEELFAALPEEERALWQTALYAGLRRGELRALRWSDVDLETNVIVVERSWDEKEGPVAPKSEKGRRRVPLIATLRRLLLEHKLRTGRDGVDFVFGRSADRPFTPTNIRDRALAAWEAANARRREDGRPELVSVGLHELRHSYVSLMHDAGFSLERIGDYVGHSSAYMTDAYRHLLEGHEVEAAERFEAYLNNTAAEAPAL